MGTQEQGLDERRADCRIWAHMLLWWIVPFGWIFSTYKMRYGIPVYVMLGAVCLSVVTMPPTTSRSNEKAFVEGVQHGQKYSLVGSVIGSALTVKEILESRKKLRLKEIIEDK